MNEKPSDMTKIKETGKALKEIGKAILGIIGIVLIIVGIVSIAGGIDCAIETDQVMARAVLDAHPEYAQTMPGIEKLPSATSHLGLISVKIYGGFYDLDNLLKTSADANKIYPAVRSAGEASIGIGLGVLFAGIACKAFS